VEREKILSESEDRGGDSKFAVEALERRSEMKREQLHLFQEYDWEETDGVDGNGLCEGEEVYAGELLDAYGRPYNDRSGGLPYLPRMISLSL
jgi:hypothetical protein